jgi:hypothetical protein
MNTTIPTHFAIQLRRSERKLKPAIIWEEKGAPSAAKDLKITKKNARTEEKTTLKPVATGPLPESIEFDEKHLSELSIYKPPLNL